MVAALHAGTFCLALLGAFYRLVFLRDPHRTPPPGRTLVSPADGRIAEIRPVSSGVTRVEKGRFGLIDTLVDEVAERGYLISITMGPLDVHWQRAPAAGKVLARRYSRGRFTNAMRRAGASRRAVENEKNEILLACDGIRVKVIQIAGILARRIVCLVEEAQTVAKGEKIGLIKLGSQVCLVIPELPLEVKVGQRVRAGETVIARY